MNVEKNINTGEKKFLTVQESIENFLEWLDNNREMLISKDINTGETKYVTAQEYKENDNLVGVTVGINIIKDINTGEKKFVTVNGMDKQDENNN